MEQRILQSIVDFARLCIWLLIIMMIFIPLERICALHPQKLVRKAFFIDLLYYFINNIIPKLLLIVPLAFLGWSVKHVVPGAFLASVAALPFWARSVAALVVGEIGFYWGHRLTHQVPFLWRFHAIHHAAEEMDWLVNTHAHPLDMVFTRLCGFIPLYILGLSQPSTNSVDSVSFFVIFASTLWGFFVHANLRWRFGPLEWLLATPAFHHWHHTHEGPLDKNFASILPFIDVVFGTHHLPKNAWPQSYGTDTPVSPDLSAQLADPLFTGRHIQTVETAS